LLSAADVNEAAALPAATDIEGQSREMVTDTDTAELVDALVCLR